MRKTGALAPLVLLCAASGCAVPLDFTSPSPLGDGVRGKRWRVPQYLEVNLDNVAVGASDESHNSYALTSYEDRAYLAATLYEPVAGRFKGYGRLYTDGSGWSAVGPNFGVIADDSVGSNSLFSAAIGAGPGGLIVAAFYADNVAVSLTAMNNGSWQTATRYTGSTGPDFSAATDSGFFPPASMAFDKLGRGYVSTVSGGGSAQSDLWEQAGGTGSTITLGAATTASQVTSVFDGNRRQCGFYRNSATSSYRCYDSVGLAQESAFDLTTAGAGGVAVATDGEGAIMSVFYELVSSSYVVKANLITDGTKQTTATTISTGMASGFEAAASNADGKAHQPGVAYLGEGRYLAAWAAADYTNDDARLYYALYDPAAGGWAAPAAVNNLEEYSVGYPYRSLTLSGNGDSNAVLAVRYYTVDDYGNRIYKLLVSRYQIQNGWVETTVQGNGCDADSADDLTEESAAYCTQRPDAVCLPSGTAVVVFQDQDSSGNFRLVGIDFR
jgi:hypothetical protein